MHTAASLEISIFLFSLNVEYYESLLHVRVQEADHPYLYLHLPAREVKIS